jgi:hypothetical protein
MKTFHYIGYVIRNFGPTFLTAILLLLSPSISGANPPLANTSFEIVGPNGSPTATGPLVLGAAGFSAALRWSVFHNTAGSTTTSIVSTTLGGSPGIRAMTVETDGDHNGIVQTTGGPNTGPVRCIAYGWVLVDVGVVGMGAGNGGSTQATSVVSTTTGAWEYLQVENFDTPCNEIVFYSIGGGADFTVDDVGLKEIQDIQAFQNVEYSNAIDERAIVGGGNHAGLDPGQILYTEPLDTLIDFNPMDVVDIYPAIESGDEPDAQIDALASGSDVGLDDVIDNTEALRVSFLGDPGAVTPVSVYREEITGTATEEFYQRDINFPNLPGDLEDLDAMELWRSGDTFDLDDSDFHSIEGDVGGTSVYQFLTGVPIAYITQAQIYGAISGSLNFLGVEGEVDVDALMVRDLGQAGIWDTGDEVLFSIRSADTWTGVEIVHWRFGAAATFLSHGGHLWDSAFVPSSSFPVTDADRDVDAIEVPEPGAALGLLFGAAGLWCCNRYRRWRSA